MHLAARCPCQWRIPAETRARRALPAWGRLPRSVRDLQLPPLCPPAVSHWRPCAVASCRQLCWWLAILSTCWWVLLCSRPWRGLLRSRRKWQLPKWRRLFCRTSRSSRCQRWSSSWRWVEPCWSPFSLLLPHQMLFPTHPCHTGNSHCFPSDLDASSKPLSSVSRQLTLMASTAWCSWTKPCVC